MQSIKSVFSNLFITCSFLLLGCNSNSQSTPLKDLTGDFKSVLPYQSNNLYGVLDTITNNWVIPAKYKTLEFIDDKRLMLVTTEKEKFEILSIKNEVVLSFKSTAWIDTKKVNDSIFSAYEITEGLSTPISYLIKIKNNKISVEEIPNMLITQYLVNEKGIFGLANDMNTKNNFVYSVFEHKVLVDNLKEPRKVSNYLISDYTLDSKEYMMDFTGKKTYSLWNSFMSEVENMPGYFYIKSNEERDYKRGIINENGEIILEPIYKDILRRNKNMLTLEDGDGKKFLFIKNKSELLPLVKYENNSDQNHVLIETETTKQIIDSTNRVVLDYSAYPHMEISGFFSWNANNPLFFNVKDENNKRKTGLMLIKNSKPEFIIYPKYYSVNFDKNYVFATTKIRENEENTLWEHTIMDLKGKELLSFKRTSYSVPGFATFNGNYLLSTSYEDKKYTFYNHTGAEIWRDKKYEKITIDKNDSYIIGFKNGMMDVYDKNLKLQYSLSIPRKDVSYDYVGVYRQSKSGAILCDIGSNYYFIDTINKKLSRSFTLDENFENYHIVYFTDYQDSVDVEEPDHLKYYHAIVDINGNYLLKPDYESISYEKGLDIIVAVKNGLIEVYDKNLNLLHEADKKITHYRVDEKLKLIFLSDEYETYSFYMDTKGKKLIK